MRTIMVYVIFWVDDIIVCASTTQVLTETKDLLKEHFKMKDLGPISWFLGVQFKQTKMGVEMTQSHYLKGLLKKFGMEQCKPR